MTWKVNIKHYLRRKKTISGGVIVPFMVPCDVHDRCIFSAISHSIGKRLMKRSMQAFCLLWFPLYSRCCFVRLVHFAHYCSGAKPAIRIFLLFWSQACPPHFFIVLVPSLASAFLAVQDSSIGDIVSE